MNPGPLARAKTSQSEDPVSERFMSLRLLPLAAALFVLPAFAQERSASEPGHDPAPIEAPDAEETSASKVPLAEIRRYVAVYNAVKEAYVEPIDDNTLMQSDICGLLFDVDPHSTYMAQDH